MFDYKCCTCSVRDSCFEGLNSDYEISAGKEYFYLQEIEVFDVYEGENIDSNKKSVAFSLLFNGITRTLTDEEVMEVFNKIIDKVVSTHNAELRDK